MKKEGLVYALTNYIIIAIIVVAISIYFLFNETYLGFSFIILGIIAIPLSKMLKIKLKSIYPDIMFGFIDNFILIFAAVLGGTYGGVVGAVIGGAAGNTLTDGLGGLFEGYVAKRERKHRIKTKRNPMSTMIGKVIGCLFGAGIGLTLIWIVRMIF